MYFEPPLRLFSTTIAQGDRSNKEITLKKALTLIGIASAALAIALPAQASFDSFSSPQAKAKQIHVVKTNTKVSPTMRRRIRVLCICFTGPVTPVPALTEQELEAQIDQDMIDHGLPPIYNTATTSADTTPDADASGA
jgi:hypothetical protein